MADSWNVPRKIQTKSGCPRFLPIKIMSWNEVKNESEFPPVWDFEKNKTIEGKYVGKRQGIGKYKKNVYQIETKNGAYDVWGSTVLDRKMGEVDINQLVQITFLGEAKGQNGSYKDFAVLVDDEA
jgi:hypothetical protein